MKRNIPFFNYSALFEAEKENLLEVIGNVIGKGAFIMQNELHEFESNLSGYLGVKHAIGLGNCTDALHFAFRAAEIEEGDEVIFPSHTMVASPAAIYFSGATPVPVECGADHLLDPGAVKSAITSRTKVIMPVQLNGRTCNMDEIQAIANEHNLLIIEDSAQALGSRFKGQYAGTFGVAGTFSFYPAKTLGCMGDGGALVTNDDTVAEKVKLLRDHGRAENGEVVMWGLNSRLDNQQAAVLNYMFQKYERSISYRRNLAGLYHDQLKGLAQIQLPPGPEDDPEHFDIYQNYEIEAEDRNALKSYLAELGVGTLIQWGGKAVHQFSNLGFKQQLPYTDQLFEKLLMLPMNQMLSEEDVLYISGSIKRFYGSK